MCCVVDVDNTKNTPIETLERAFPLRVVRYRLRQGSGGARCLGGAARASSATSQVLVDVTVSLITDAAGESTLRLGPAESGADDQTIVRVFSARLSMISTARTIAPPRRSRSRFERSVWHDRRRVGAHPCGSRGARTHRTSVADGMRRAFAAIVLVAVVVLSFVGCGSDDEADPITAEEFEAGLVAREQFTPETADCIRSYLLGEYPDADLRQLAAAVPEGGSTQLWARYTQVVLACQFHDDLGVPATDGAS